MCCVDKQTASWVLSFSCDEIRMIRKMMIRWHPSLSLRSHHTLGSCVISYSQVQLNSSFLSTNTRPNWASDHANSHRGSDKKREKPGPEITTLFNTEWRTSSNISSCTLVSLIQNIKVFNWSSMPSNCIVNLFCSCPLFSLLQATISMYNMKQSVPRPLLSWQGWIQGTITLTFRDLNDEQ